MRACRRAWLNASPSAGKRALKILLLKPSSLGDVVQALPVLRCLKLHLPHAQIHWWIETGLAPLIEDDPDLAGVVRFDRRRWGHPARWGELYQSIQWTRAQRFDWVIDLQCLARSAAFAWLANGRRLVGLDEPREGARGFYDLAARRRSWDTHAVDWYLDVLPMLGVPVRRDFVWLPERPAIAAAIRGKWALGDHQWVALQPGARWRNKRWPAGHFAALVKQLAAAVPGLRFALLGGREDAPLTAEIAAAAPNRCLDLAGRVSLPEMVEWLRACRAMVTNDTGPMHVAAALGIPVVALFGPTAPARTGPYGQLHAVHRHPLPCAPCMKQTCAHSPALECLTALSPARIADALVRALGPG